MALLIIVNKDLQALMTFLDLLNLKMVTKGCVQCNIMLTLFFILPDLKHFLEDASESINKFMNELPIVRIVPDFISEKRQDLRKMCRDFNRIAKRLDGELNESNGAH